MNEQTFTTLIPIIILLWHLLSVGAGYISDLLKQMQPDNKWSRMLDIVTTSVRQVEQEYSQGVGQGGLNSANKKNEALKTIELLCEKFGIKFNQEIAGKLIEDAVYALNVAQGKISSGQSDTRPTTIMPVIPKQQ